MERTWYEIKSEDSRCEIKGLKRFTESLCLLVSNRLRLGGGDLPLGDDGSSLITCCYLIRHTHMNTYLGDDGSSLITCCFRQKEHDGRRTLINDLPKTVVPYVQEHPLFLGWKRRDLNDLIRNVVQTVRYVCVCEGVWVLIVKTRVRFWHHNLFPMSHELR